MRRIFSHGFRPGRSCFSALRELYGQVRAGHLYIVDVDIEKFFDTIAPLEAEGVAFVRYADDVRLMSRTPAGARKALRRTEEVLAELRLRLNPKKTRLVSIQQGVDFLGIG